MLKTGPTVSAASVSGISWACQSLMFSTVSSRRLPVSSRML